MLSIKNIVDNSNRIQQLFIHLLRPLTAQGCRPSPRNRKTQWAGLLTGQQLWELCVTWRRDSRSMLRGIKNRGDQRQQQPRMNHNEYNMNTQWARQAHSDNNNKATSPQAESQQFENQKSNNAQQIRVMRVWAFDEQGQKGWEREREATRNVEHSITF